MTFEVSPENVDPFILAEHWIEDAVWKAEHYQLEFALMQLDKAHEILELDRKKERPLVEMSDYRALTKQIADFRAKYES